MVTLLKAMANPYQDWTDDQLAEYQAKNEPTGRPIFEMMRRLKDSLVEQAKTTNKLNTRLYWFTVAIFVFTAGMFFLGVIQLFVKP